MGYHVKIEELLEVQNQMISQLSEWGTQLESVYQTLETIVVTPCIQGETGKSIQNYIREVHIPVIGSLQQLLTEFQVRLSVYAEGYYGIDSSYEAEIPQEILEEQQQVLENGREDFENLREEINSVISSVSDIVSVVQPSGLALVLSYQLMESRVKTLNSDIGDYEETHQNDTQNMNSMLESIRSILIARTGSPAISVTNYQAGSIAMLPSYQRLQMEYEASGNFVAQNIAQYEAAMKKFEDKMNDKLADDRKAEGLKQFLSGIVSVTVGTALIFATAGAATPIVLSAAVVGGTSTLYGLSNATEGMNNISLGFSGDGFAVAENPIRDTLFAGNPELYYTIGNASTMISAMALPMSGILKGATGATKFKAIAVDGGRILIGNVAEDKVYDVIYQSTDSRILAMLGSNVVEGVLSGNPVNSSVSEIGDVARKTDIEELGDDLIDLRRKGFEGVSNPERLIPGKPGVVTGGDSTKLGKNIMESMGLKRSTKWTGHQAQHIIPAEMADNPILQKIGMNLDDATNGILLRTPDAELSAMSRHRGYHSVYNNVVRNQLNKMDINQSVDVLQKQVFDLQSDLRKLQESGLPLYPNQGATVELWERSLSRIRK